MCEVKQRLFSQVAGRFWVIAAVLVCWVGPALGQAFSPPCNDIFTNARVIVGDSGIIIGGNIGATNEPSEPVHWQPVNAPPRTNGASIWYRWTAPNDGLVTFDTVGSAFDTVLAVY